MWHGSHCPRNILQAKNSDLGYVQICENAARLPVWQLRDGRLTTVQEGCFVQANVANIGSAALDYMQRTLPLFDVPIRVKISLEKAGVTGCREITPSTIRCASFLSGLDSHAHKGSRHRDLWLLAGASEAPLIANLPGKILGGKCCGNTTRWGLRTSDSLIGWYGTGGQMIINSTLQQH
jgi:hypothetical protein